MNFDRLAPHYDWMEAVTAGRLLQRARTHWLDRLDGCRRVLSVGEGHGRFGAAFARRFPRAELTCVEASAAMLARAQRRAARAGPAAAAIRWVHADVRAWRPPAGAFDAIVTSFFLDCFAPATLHAVVRQLAAAAQPRAGWLVVDFTMPSHGWRRFRARAIHRMMYAFFRQATRLEARRLTPPDGALRAAGFQLRGRRGFSAGLVQADWWERRALPRHGTTRTPGDGERRVAGAPGARRT